MPSADSDAQRRYFVEFSGRVKTTSSFRDRLALFRSRTTKLNGSAFIITPRHSSSHLNMKPLASLPQFDSVQQCNEAPLTSILAMKTIVSRTALKAHGPNITFDRCVTNTRLPRHLTQSIREHSIFSLVLRGDTHGSDRLQNSIAAGAIPVGVGDDFDDAFGWAPFQRIVDYAGMCVFIKRSEFWKDAAKAINTLRELPQEVLAKKRRLLRHHRADLDWVAKGARVTDNMLYEAAACRCDAYNRL